jgi:hypothetical protein
MRQLEHNTAKDVLRAGDGCLCGCLLGVIVLVALLMFLNAGCATCPPCQPEIRTVEVSVPIYSCPDPPELPALQLPSWGDIPEESATPEALKDWFAEMVRTVHSRDSVQSSYIDYLISLLEEYRQPE